MLKRNRGIWRCLALVALIGLTFASCEGEGGNGVDPIETACEICVMLDESGICDMIQELEAEKCAAGQTLVLTNVQAALEDGVPLETGCR